MANSQKSNKAIIDPLMLDYSAYDQSQKSTNQISFKVLLMTIISNWYWFVISILICMGIAGIYLATSTFYVTRQASILIKDENSNPNSGTVLMNLTFGNGITNIENEKRIFQSPIVMREVVLRLNLNNSYYLDKPLRKDELYRKAPVVVMPRDAENNHPFSMDMVVEANGDVFISNVTEPSEDGDDIEFPGEIKAKIGQTVTLPNKMVVTLLKPKWNGSKYYGERIIFKHTDLIKTSQNYANHLSAGTMNEQSSIVTLKVMDPSRQKADDILAAVMTVYNDQWLEDKNQVAISTSRFIDERLGVIERELGNVDTDISSYKSSNLIPDVSMASQMFMQEDNVNSQAIFDLSNQISMARLMRNELQKSGINEVLPATSGITNTSIQSMMNDYNRMVLERNRLLATSSEKNPIVSDLTSELRPMRNNIMRSLDTYIQTLTTQMKNAEARSNNNISKIAANPGQAKHLLSIERQQKVKESLYLFLLQKREENQLSQAFTAYNTRIIEEPMKSDIPIYPSKTKVMLAAIALGLIIPLIYFYLRILFDTKIRSKHDLKTLSSPYLGEIPQNGKVKSGILSKINPKKHKNVPDHEIIVTPTSRDAINEAFRVIRTNIEFMINSESNRKPGGYVFAITSANPGSGKTFISLNLADVFVIKRHKVIAIDLDLRRGSLSKYMGSPKPGITDYLINKADLKDIIRYDINGQKGFDAISIGSVPPNPAELLASNKLVELIDELRKEYEYIFLDCPPVEIVTDALIINRVADRTIFVIRAGLLRRDTLEDIEEFYQSERYRNITILLNGTSTYGGYGYNRYGYKYDSTTQYGYGDDMKK